MAKEAQPRALQLCVFDTERDYAEGEEARQILAYHPETCSITDQTSVVGLAQALLTFCRNFEEVQINMFVVFLFASKHVNRLLCCRMHPVIACMPIEVSGPFTGQRRIL